MKRFELFLMSVAGVLLVVSCATMPSSSTNSAAVSDPKAPHWKNLQLLRKDMPREELIGIMRRYSRSLGVRCSFCHEGEEGALDFASDAKDEKRAARVMMRMTRAINEQYIAKLDAQGSVVDCYTCHRGKPVPEDRMPEEPPHEQH